MLLLWSIIEIMSIYDLFLFSIDITYYIMIFTSTSSECLGTDTEEA